MVCSWAAHASYSGRMAPPGRPNTSVTPSASRQRMIASAPVIRVLSTGHQPPVKRVLGELGARRRAVAERIADRLADLPGGVHAPAGHLVGGGDAVGEHRVDRRGDRPADVAPVEAIRE